MAFNFKLDCEFKHYPNFWPDHNYQSSYTHGHTHTHTHTKCAADGPTLSPFGTNVRQLSEGGTYCSWPINITEQ